MKSVRWGDLHAHCAASYGSGTPAHALAAARKHLDFCSITGHAFWPDLPMTLAAENAYIEKHLGAFQKLRRFWPELLQELAAATEPGRFVAFPSFEWHSCAFGDYNVYFKGPEPALVGGDSPEELCSALADTGMDFMLVPHHCGYAPGHRGTNWAAWPVAAAPLVEVYSNHGCGEADDAPYEYHHSMGPRTGESVARSGLLAGHRFGFSASTDNHDGYPGHYGHGIVGVIDAQRTRDSLWEGMSRRRTIASTGARIAAEVELDGAGIGQVVTRRSGMDLVIAADGTAPVEQVDLVEAAAGRWQVRHLPGRPISAEFESGRCKIRIEAGWGCFGSVSEWMIRARIRNGRLLAAEPCFRYSIPAIADTAVSERLQVLSGDRVEWRCRAAANAAGGAGGTHFAAGGTQSVVLDVEAGPTTRLQVESESCGFDLAMTDLLQHSVVQHRAGFLSPALKVHRAVPEREFRFRYEERYQPLADGAGFLYIRIRQSDGQTAWVSPIWFE